MFLPKCIKDKSWDEHTCPLSRIQLVHKERGRFVPKVSNVWDLLGMNRCFLNKAKWLQPTRILNVVKFSSVAAHIYPERERD